MKITVYKGDFTRFYLFVNPNYILGDNLFPKYSCHEVNYFNFSGIDSGCNVQRILLTPDKYQ